MKPRSILFMSILTGIDVNDIGNFISGLLFFIIALVNLPTPSIFQWMFFIILFLLSILTLFSFALFMSGSLFIWQGNDRIYELYSSISLFGLFPASIYSKVLRNIVLFIIPIAMIGFFPASILLGRKVEGIFISIIVCMLFFMLSLFFWHTMVKRYSSAGG
jgi:ABC-2 type transport system permease protein